MPSNYNLEAVAVEIRSRLAPFMIDLEKNIPEQLQAAYLTGPSARGEFNAANPEINLLLVFKNIGAKLLDHISALGRKYGKSGIRAPLLLTSEYMINACDSFPIELLDLKSAHIAIYGDDALSALTIADKDLRLQCERNLRSWRLNIRQAYLRSAGDAGWLNEWFMDSIIDMFPLLRAVMHLLGGNTDCGNTETASRLSSMTGIDFTPFSEAWNLRKAGQRFEKKDVFAQFDHWETALAKLVEKIDALEVR